MVFSSLEFLFIFLPSFLILYYITPTKYKNAWIFIGSLGFYSYGALENPLYILLIIASVLINYVLGVLIAYYPHRNKLWLVLGVVYNLGWLFVFKYADFLFNSINQIIHIVRPSSIYKFPILELLLPIGISFYTFQILSYLIDVYNGTIRAELSFINLGAYLCMFPQLIAGPIVTFRSVSQQLKFRNYTLKLFNEGLKDFTLGLGLKVLIANQVGRLWTEIATIGYESISTPLSWMGIFSFSLQIYFDFYGYSLMAIGLGKLLGFQLPQNFDYPYLSLSMTEFWRRWHITLGSWFREYVYIPLGGNRHGAIYTLRNLFIVWMLTGLWHGASWNFILWGFILYVLLVAEKHGLKKILHTYKLFGHIYMIGCILLTWLVFAITDFTQLGIYFGRLFPFFHTPTATIFEQDYLKYGKQYGIIFIVGLLFCTKLPRKIYETIKDSILCTTILLLIFWASVYFLYIGLNDPFLYFRF